MVVGFGVGLWLVERFQLVSLLKRPIAQYLPNGQLVVTSPTEPLMIVFKLGFMVGLVLASPIILWQTWAFLSPALYEREKNTLVPALFVGLGLFLAGAILAYVFVVPQALRVLFSFQSDTIAPMITYDNYFGFVLQICLALGLSFELPLPDDHPWLGVIGPDAAPVPSLRDRALVHRGRGALAGRGRPLDVHDDDPAAAAVRDRGRGLGPGAATPKGGGHGRGGAPGPAGGADAGLGTRRSQCRSRSRPAGLLRAACGDTTRRGPGHAPGSRSTPPAPDGSASRPRRRGPSLRRTRSPSLLDRPGYAVPVTAPIPPRSQPGPAGASAGERDDRALGRHGRGGVDHLRAGQLHRRRHRRSAPLRTGTGAGRRRPDTTPAGGEGPPQRTDQLTEGGTVWFLRGNVAQDRLQPDLRRRANDQLRPADPALPLLAAR